jgi:hypothetical protein
MEDRLSRLESQVELLGQRLEEVIGRLQQVEESVGLERPHEEPPEPAPPQDLGPSELQLPAVTTWVTLFGRSLVVLGGAFFLRTITDSGYLPGLPGAMVGIVYGVLWIGAAYLAAGTGKRVSAVFHGATAVIIINPLVFEMTVHFVLFTESVAAVLVAGLAFIGLFVCERRNLRTLAWLITLAGLVTSMSLIVATNAVYPLTWSLLAFAAMSLWLALRRSWFGLRWAVAPFVDLTVLELGLLITRPEGLPEAYSTLRPVMVIIVQLALVLLYLGAATGRTVIQKQPISGFSLLQGSLAVAIGYGGALRVAALTGTWFMGLTVIGFMGSAAAYAVFLRIRDRRNIGRELVAVSTLALILLLIPSALVIPRGALGPCWMLMALIALWLGNRLRHSDLRAHSAALTIGAALASGLLPNAVRVILTSADPRPSPLSMSGTLVAAAAAVSFGLLAYTTRSKRLDWSHHLLRLVIMTVIVMTIATALVLLLWIGAIQLGVRADDSAMLAMVRTSVLAVIAMVLAVAGRQYTWAGVSWLAYVFLGFGGIKLLFEDLPHGRPLTLFVALAMIGSALIVVARTRAQKIEQASPEAVQTNGRSGG